VKAFQQLTESSFFKGLSYENQMLLLELVSGAQTGQMKEILDSHGWERILTFIYGKHQHYCRISHRKYVTLF
jgi:hypothetical protein